MTSTDLVRASTAYSRASIPERLDYAQKLAAGSSLLPGDRRSVGQILVLAEAGDMLGIHPMAALTGVYIVEGRPSISANLMNGLVRRAGHTLRVKVEGEGNSLKATATLIRKDDPDFEFISVWDKARADAAGLWNKKGPWQQYKAAMLKSRAIAEVVREGAADVLMGGNVYTPEELNVDVKEDGEPVDLKQVTPEDSADPSPAPPETPIKDERPLPPEDIAAAWIEQVANLSSRDQALALYRQEQTTGNLNLLLPTSDGGRIELGRLIIETGQALKEAEDAVGGPLDDSTPAALDDDVVEAEIVEDEVAAERAAVAAALPDDEPF